MIGEFGLAQTFVSSIVFAVDVEESFGFCFHKAAVDHGIGSFDVGEGFFNVDDEGVGVQGLSDGVGNRFSVQAEQSPFELEGDEMGQGFPAGANFTL